MTLAMGSIAAASATAGTDLLQNDTNRSSTVNRQLVAIGLAGSAAVNDTEARLMVGNLEVARIFNTSTGSVQVNTDMFRVGVPVAAASQISLVLISGATTNPVNYAMDLIG